MPRVIFLFNHDASHQVAHLAPVAAALALTRPEIETVVAFATESIRKTIESLMTDEARELVTFKRLDLPPVVRAIAGIADRILPASRLARLRWYERYFAEAAAVVSTERTCLRVQKRIGPDHAPLFIRVPHGTGDRSVTFHPDHRRFDLSLVAGPKMAEQLAENGVDRAKIVVTGYSKFEKVDLSAKPAFFDNDRPVFVYNPHFDPHLSSWYDLGPDILRWFASEAGQAYNLVFAPHVMLFRKGVHVSPEYKVAKRRPDIPSEALRASNIITDIDGPRLFDMSYMLGADVYLGDASSQIYEFLIRPRATFLIDPNGALASEGPDTLPFLKTGKVVSALEELPPALAQWRDLASEYRAEQERLIAHTFALSETPPSRRAADAIALAIDDCARSTT